MSYCVEYHSDYFICVKSTENNKHSKKDQNMAIKQLKKQCMMMTAQNEIRASVECVKGMRVAFMFESIYMHIPPYFLRCPQS